MWKVSTQVRVSLLAMLNSSERFWRWYVTPVITVLSHLVHHVVYRTDRTALHPQLCPLRFNLGDGGQVQIGLLEVVVFGVKDHRHIPPKTVVRIDWCNVSCFCALFLVKFVVFVFQDIMSFVIYRYRGPRALRILEFKLSPCYECCILSSGWFPGVWILCADVSEHCSIFIGRLEDGTECSETSAHKIQTPENRPKERIQYFLLFIQSV